MKTWNVVVDGRCIGSVHEDNEALARCAALSKYGFVESDDFVEEDPSECIPPDADFSVSLASI